MGNAEEFTFTEYTLTQIIDRCMTDMVFAEDLLSGDRERQWPALVQYVPEDKVEGALEALDPILESRELIEVFFFQHTDPKASPEIIAV